MKQVFCGFDVDGCALDLKYVQYIIKSLSKHTFLKRCIVTSRNKEIDSEGQILDNSDIYQLAEDVGIHYQDIYFTAR